MNKEKIGYFSSTLKNTAEKRFGIAIPEKVTQDWKTLVQSGLSLDKLYDSISNRGERRAFFDHFKEYVAGKTNVFALPRPDSFAEYYRKDFNQEVAQQVQERTARLRTVVQGLPKERQERFLRRLDHFRFITEEMREEKESTRFRRLRRIEGNVWIGFFHDVLPLEITQHHKFAHYKDVINAIARAGNSFDQCKDLWGDYKKKKKIKVQPTPTNEILLFKDAIYEGVQTLRYLIPQKKK